MPMMWGYYGNNTGMMVWGVISSLFCLVLAGVVVWAVIRWLGHISRSTTTPQPPQVPTSQQQSPLDILKARYARGEIDAATYQSMREQLEEPADIAPQAKEPIPSGR